MISASELVEKVSLPVPEVGNAPACIIIYSNPGEPPVPNRFILLNNTRDGFIRRIPPEKVCYHKVLLLRLVLFITVKEVSILN